MQRLRTISICILSVTSIMGIVRGIRMIHYTGLGEDFALSPYPKDTIRATIFSNYNMLGWIILSLVGFFGLVVIAAIAKRVRNYAYFVIVEGIFISFLTSIHILLTGFVLAHFLVIPFCFALIILGILQVPREF